MPTHERIVITNERKVEIMRLVDRYNRDDSKGPPISPFIAQAEGKLSQVAKQIGVPTPELNEFLNVIDRELPTDHLMG